MAVINPPGTNTPDIVFTASGSVYAPPQQEVLVYDDDGTSKRGLFHFVKCLALAGGPHNARAFCVAPGPVLTRAGMAAMQTPLCRAADPIEIVDFILGLCSDRSSFVTGTTHFIDGGRLAAH